MIHIIFVVLFSPIMGKVICFVLMWDFHYNKEIKFVTFPISESVIFFLFDAWEHRMGMVIFMQPVISYHSICFHRLEGGGGMLPLLIISIYFVTIANFPNLKKKMLFKGVLGASNFKILTKT